MTQGDKVQARGFMTWSKRLLAAVSLGTIALHPGAMASAQPNSAAQAGNPTSAQPGPLENLVDVRAGGNDGAAEVQREIDTISDETDSLLAQYRTALKQIDSIDLYNQQMRDLLGAQDRELASLTDQLERVDEVGRSVTPLMIRMIDAIEKFVELDIPFLIDERTERVAELGNLMARADVTTSEKYRQIMAAYQIENEYGRTIEAYRDGLILNDKETTVDFLRFGRIALVYQSLDESQSGVWDQQTRAWLPLDSSFRSAIRQGLRVARRTTAPDLISLPLPAAVDARESS
jgi:hypothetical protein